ncbi:MAG: threonylcarbamoyl-AMP synthase [Candidatus Omnitrophica bacterium]|nr:threonylcarbamoyl-AMP synthase [Candidatus Omnitrophota bacterium]
MNTEVIRIDPENIELDKIEQAAQVIKRGGIVGFPTETVYGLAADFFNQQAVERIFTIKKRPADKYLTVQISDIAYLEKLNCQVPDYAYKLISKFWPGPLTLVLKRAEETLGLRIPDNQIAQSLIKQSSTCIVAPSANLSGEPPAQTAEEVVRVFNGLIEMLIDAGKTALGIASTVLDLTVSPYRILRKGAISQEQIEGLLR